MVIKNKVILNDGSYKGLGYRKGLNSIRDYNDEEEKLIQEIDKKIALALDTGRNFTGPHMPKNEVIDISLKAAPASTVDISPDMSPVRDQGYLGSCTAYAATGMVEYMQKKVHKKYQECSTLFTYKTTRNMMQEKGDVGAYIRSAMGSIAMIGVAPEKYWPYDGREEQYNDKFDLEPDNFVYHLAQNYQSVKYLRLDQPNVTTAQLLDKLKYYLRFARIPIMFGFTVYESIEQSSDTDSKGLIPFPHKTENILGGHAILLAGYDDEKVIENKLHSDVSTKGAFKFKNSWGREWGLDGYGYLPYEYFLKRQADDCWILMSQEFVDCFQFQE